MSDPFDTKGLRKEEPQPVRPPNPLDDLASFASDSIRRHEDMQAATRRLVANAPAVETKRTFVEMSPPKSFATPPSGNKPVKEIASTQNNSGSLLFGSFYGMYIDEDGHTWLQGGQVKCGTSETLADYKVIDGTTGPVEIAGSLLVIEVTLDGYVEDGILLAGITATAIIYVSPVDVTIPADTLPTVGSFTGKKCYLEVGRWTANSFLPSRPGHFIVSFCGTGSYTIKPF